MKVVDAVLKLDKRGKILGKQDNICYVYHDDTIYLTDSPDSWKNTNECVYDPRMKDAMESETAMIIETDKWTCVFAKDKFDAKKVLEAVVTLLKKYYKFEKI